MQIVPSSSRAGAPEAFHDYKFAGTGLIRFRASTPPRGPLTVSGDRSAESARGIFWKSATGLELDSENLRTVRSDHDGRRFRLWVFV